MSTRSVPLREPPTRHDAAHRRCGYALAALLLVGGCDRGAPGPAALRDVRAIRVGRAAGPVQLDGQLREPAWARASSLGPLVDAQRGEVETRPHRALVLYDADALYVGVEIDDAELRAPPVAPAGTEPPLCGLDCLTVFLDASGRGQDYAEVQLSPLGALFDTRWSAPRTPAPNGVVTWKSNAIGAVSSRGTVEQAGDRDGGWSAELRVPWSALGRTSAPDAQSLLRANVVLRDVAHNGDVRTLAWSAVLANDLHVPPRFGRLTFAP